MRIVIDMQGAQASNAPRGIGRYTFALAKALTQLRGEHEVLLALNSIFPESIDSIRSIFSKILPQECIHVWDLNYSANGAIDEDIHRRKAAEISREAFLLSLNPDVILNISLFEGFGDNAVTSIASFSSEIPTAVLLHDLIPWIHREKYLTNPVFERWYLGKLDHLRRADLILSNSLSTAQEALDILNFHESKVVNISSACEDHFKPLVATENQRLNLKNKYKLTKPFVMYTGGIDHRKNIEGLIRAYAKLPLSLRTKHQLAIVCSIQQTDRERLLNLAKKEGVTTDELVITGFVSEEDLLTLYNSCKLFVFPSWHEGFGLPALEAMACGRAVIGANTSSIPEVIGRKDALFDPLNDDAMAQKIQQVLTNDVFRAELELHGLVQAKNFSWDETARRAWAALTTLVSEKTHADYAKVSTRKKRPRMAYFSPLPPQKSGISDYSVELLPELSRHYEIEVIATQDEIVDSWVHANCAIRTVAWFRENAHRFDRVLYHFGNSDFHSHMFELLAEFDGVVVLHDFFLSGIVAHLDGNGEKPNSWAQTLVNGHGWPALVARYKAQDTAEVVYAYPANMEVLQQALGVIVHSENSKRMANAWFGLEAAADWGVIPLLRRPPIKNDRSMSRTQLGLSEKDFVVCSFGLLGPTKLNDRLITAWLASPMAKDPHCHLVFVGQNHGGEYGVQLVRTIRGHTSPGKIEITGWTDAKIYRKWLESADVGVQLRTLSRGETSAAVLDCMNYGIATVVNANGSMADIPKDVVWMLSDEFGNDQLLTALATLWKDSDRRSALGRRAKKLISTNHQPRRCAEQYFGIIEQFYNKSSFGIPALLNQLSDADIAFSANDRELLATAISNNFPPQPRRKQLLLDISELVQRDAKSGIQRVVRSLMRELILSPPDGWAVEPVYANADTPGYRYARRFTSRFLDVYDGWTDDEPVDAWPGDVFLGLDLQPVIVPAQKETLLKWNRRGVKVHFVIYDLIPVLMPHVFPEMARAMHHRWLETISLFDGALCISRAVSDELIQWLDAYGPKRERPLNIGWFHLGADVENSVPTKGIPPEAEKILVALKTRPSFLTVGTLEPRKGHGQLLSAFEQLWEKNIDVNLVIVGKQGWLVEELIEKIHSHRELEKRLFWLDSISDEYLEKIYSTCSCLIAASEGEGFGLPLIEAAQYKLPIIARDIPVFREVANNYAQFFENSSEPLLLASIIQDWLALYKNKKHPRSAAMPWLTWKSSADQLIKAIMSDSSTYRWLPDGAIRYWGSDNRISTQVGQRKGRSLFTSKQSGFLIFGPHAKFPAGEYTIYVHGSLQNTTSNDFLDVVTNRGTIKLLYAQINLENKSGINREYQFSLPDNVQDLEFRVWVDSETILSVSNIVVSRSQLN
jgi:glycosyltransferase involved in cell wall biosynthesis